MNNEVCIEKGQGIEEFIRLIRKLKKDDLITVFRGETEDYGKTACQPNIFREGYLDNNEFFEKNILDEMTANHLARGDSYLEKAINAQHGGFPSRLLDVSYNSLIGLFFAITPFYTKKINTTDKMDGFVYVFYLDEMFCPVGDGLKDNYDELISRKKKWYSESTLFNRNFKLIDHIKINSRIIAQQGAFILFQGLDAQPLPRSLYTKIRIKGDAKEELRKELKQLFGIHIGTVYPEEYNLVDAILDKSRATNCRGFELENELTLVLKSLERDLDDYLYEILIDKKGKKHIREVQKLIYWYKRGYEKTKEELGESECVKKDQILKFFEEEFNSLVDQCYSRIKKYYKSEYLNREETLIQLGGGMQDEEI